MFFLKNEIERHERNPSLEPWAGTVVELNANETTLLFTDGKEHTIPTTSEAWTYFWGSFFIEKLRGCRSAVRESHMERMTKKITSAEGNIFQLQKMVMPVNVGGGHWALIVAYMKERKLRSFDSMNGKHEATMEMLLELFEAEAKRLNVNFNRCNWSMEREMGIPQQGNCSDCGVFLCAFARHVVDATDFPFTQQDMDSIRARITYELVHGKEEIEGIKREMIQRTALAYSPAKYR